MKAVAASKIAGLGHYLPPNRVLNAQIEGRLGLEAGWIERRTGIKARHYALDDQALTDIAAPAAQMALDASGLRSQDIGMTLLATSTPDHLLPPSAPMLAYKLGLSRSGAIDLAGACSGFVYAMTLADGLVRTRHKPVLIVSANILSRRINPAERSSAVLFADAAGAMILIPNDDEQRGLIASELLADGANYDLIKIKAGGSHTPFAQDTDIMDTRMCMPDGQRVFTAAIAMMTQTSLAAMAQAKINPQQVDRFIPHQANLRIIEKVADNLGLNKDALQVSLDNYGNSSAATIPLTLSLAAQSKPLKSGENLLLSAVGAGFVGGALVFQA